MWQLKISRFLIISCIAILIGLAFYIQQKAFGDHARVWAVGDCHKINPVTGEDFNPFAGKNLKIKNYLWNSKTNTVTLFGAKNEYISFQIVIEAKNEDLSDVRVSFSDLVGPSRMDSENIKLFREHYTHVSKISDWPQPSTGTGEYPDALIPFDLPISIERGRNQAIWVDLYIPKEAKPGKHYGVFTVIGDEFKPQSIEICLNVMDFTLPEESHIMAGANYYALERGYGVKRDSEEYLNIEKDILRFCRKHRIEALNRHLYIRPKLENDLGDLIFVDWSSYDNRLSSLMDGSLFDDKQPPTIYFLPINIWSYQLWPENEFQMQQVCKATAKHFHEKGWDLSRGYAYMWDEPSKDDIADLKRWAQLIKESSPEIKTVSFFTSTFSEELVADIAPYIDLWMVDARHANVELFKKLKAMDKEVGFYQQGEPWCGNENLDSDGLGLRTWSWIAWKYGVDCIYLYSMVEWWEQPKEKSVWYYPRNKTWTNSQGVLIYPSADIGLSGVIGSIRMKQFRRGMQDYEYMYLAKQRGGNPDAIVDSIIKKALSETHRSDGTYGEWSHNPEDWFIARRKLASIITGEKYEEKVVSQIPASSGLKHKLKEFFRKKTPVLKSKNILYEGDFESGKDNEWTGGVVQSELTYDGSKYALLGKGAAGEHYISLEIWKKFHISEDTKLSFAYYCDNVDTLTINCWSIRHNRNFSHIINAPKHKEWVEFTKNLSEFGDDIGGSIQSIHIAAPNKEGTVLIIDSVRLYNE